MPRAGRLFEEGRIYHVFNQVAGGTAVFLDDALAVRFVELLREAIRGIHRSAADRDSENLE